MQTVTLTQVREILDECLKDYIENKNCHNILFCAPTGFCCSDKIEDWLSEHEDEINYWFDLYPDYLHKEDANGFLVKTDTIVFVDNALKRLSERTSAVFENHFNWGRDTVGDDILYELVRDRNHTSAFSKITYDLSSMFLFVCTTYPNNGRYNLVEIDDKFMDLFETYNVQPTFYEVFGEKSDWYKSIVASGKDVDGNAIEEDFLETLKKEIEILDVLKGLDCKFIDLLSPNTISRSIRMSEGDKEKFLDMINAYYDEESDEMINTIETINNAFNAQ